MKYFTLSILIMFVAGFSSCQSQQKNGSTLDAVSFKNELAAAKDAVILDVRTPGEYAEGYIDKAVNIDYNSGDFLNAVSGFDKHKTYFVYCLSGGRSSAAANKMRNNGFTKVFDLKGGIMAWQGQQFPLATAGNAMPQSTDQYSLADYDKLTASATYVLIDFYAPWCAPCRRLEPIMAELAETYKGKVVIQRINVDENKQLAIQLGVEEIPYIKIYQNGKIKGNYIGFTSKEELEKNFR